MERLGLGTRGLLGMKRVGVEVAGAGTNRDGVPCVEMAGVGAETDRG